jgi:NAD(P)-dependent dehydrogenase (short-subunit alcohol dehydrogenase family)
MSAPARVALVTGAARRIGRAIALDLARQGWAVVLHGRRRDDDLVELEQRIRAGGTIAAIVEADLAREEETHAVIERGEAALGPITCLINNASAFERDEVATVTRASWDLHLETNLRAPFVLIQELARRLPSDRSGVVVNLVDQRVWNLTPHFVSYTLSKSALWALTQSLALALAPRVRVNAVGPGPTLKSARQSDRDFARQWASTPLERGTTPDEIAAAVRFLIEAPSVTGQMIALDGGQHLGWMTPRAQPDPSE